MIKSIINKNALYKLFEVQIQLINTIQHIQLIHYFINPFTKIYNHLTTMYNLIKLLSQALKNKAIMVPEVVSRPVRSPLRRAADRGMTIELSRSAPKLTKGDCVEGTKQDFVCRIYGKHEMELYQCVN